MKQRAIGVGPIGGRLRWSDANTDSAILTAVTAAFVAFVYLRRGNVLLQATDYEQLLRFTRLFFRRTLLTEHTLPLWAPWSFAGRPFQADPSSQLLYPVEWPLLALPEGLGLVLSVWIHLAIAGGGMLALGRELGMRRSGAMLAALCFSCSGFFVARSLVGHVMYLQGAAYLPWILAATEAGVRDGDWRPYRRAGVFFGLQVLTGCIPVSWMTTWSVVVYSFARSSWPGALSQWIRTGRGLVVLLGIAAGLSAVQWLPTAELARYSVRATAGPAYTADIGFPPSHALLWLFPGLRLAGFAFRWESHPYVGVMPILAVSFALTAWRDARVRALAVLVVVGAAFMLASATPLFWLWYHLVPGYAAFRVHAREVLICCLALCALGGLGFDRLQEHVRWPALLVGVAAVLAVLGVAVGHVPWWQAGLIVVSATVLSLMRRHAAWAVPAALLVLLTDLVANAGYYPTLFQLPPGVPAHEEEIAEVLTRDPGLYRVWLPPAYFRRNAGYAIERSTIDGIAPLVLQDYADLVQALIGVPRNELSPNSISPEAFVQLPQPFPLPMLNVKYTMAHEANGWRLVINPQPSGPVMQPGDWVVVADHAALLTALRAVAFDPRQQVVFDEAPLEHPPLARGINGTARVISYGVNGLSVAIEQQRDGFVVLSEVFYPGWEAALDGRPTRLYRADGVLRAVFVPAGRHELTCTFRPLLFRIGAGISLGTLSLLVGSFVRFRRPA